MTDPVFRGSSSPMDEETVMGLRKPFPGVVESSARLPTPTPERPPKKRGMTAEELGLTKEEQEEIAHFSDLHRDTWEDDENDVPPP